MPSRGADADAYPFLRCGYRHVSLCAARMPPHIPSRDADAAAYPFLRCGYRRASLCAARMSPHIPSRGADVAAYPFLRRGSADTALRCGSSSGKVRQGCRGQPAQRGNRRPGLRGANAPDISSHSEKMPDLLLRRKTVLGVWDADASPTASAPVRARPARRGEQRLCLFAARKPSPRRHRAAGCTAPERRTNAQRSAACDKARFRSHPCNGGRSRQPGCSQGKSVETAVCYTGHREIRRAGAKSC